jgi:hypothetical protein
MGIASMPISRYLRMTTCECGVTKLINPRRGPTAWVPAWQEL